MTDYYKRHFLSCDMFVIALAMAVLFVIVWFHWGANVFAGTLTGDRQVLYSAVGQLSGSLLGFILAAASIILAVVPSSRFRVLRGSGNYAGVFQVYFQAIGWLGATCIVSFMALLGDRDADPKILLTFLVTFLSLVSISRVGHSIVILKKITSVAAESRETKDA